MKIVQGVQENTAKPMPVMDVTVMQGTDTFGTMESLIYGKVKYEHLFSYSTVWCQVVCPLPGRVQPVFEFSIPDSTGTP